jgi:tRNA (adenine57-N1/adenine58-N1)-methyltransferase
VSLPLRAGEPCLLVDTKGRRYLIELAEGAEFQYHAGTLPHAEIIGSEEGAELRSSGASRLLVLRPRLADFILTMPRGAQVVYPKDIGPILHWGDIRPGSVVLEAGTGSGALTMALVQAVGPEGRVVSVERRSDHLAHAAGTIERFFGTLPGNLSLREGDVAEMVADVAPDRVVLDLPEPWEVVAPAARHMGAGGVLTAYLPTVPQVQQLHVALRHSRRFGDVSTFEILLREWNAEGRSVRPASQMVGHTGFITVARRTALRQDPET